MKIRNLLITLLITISCLSFFAAPLTPVEGRAGEGIEASPYGYNTSSGSPFWKKLDESHYPKLARLLSGAGVKWVRVWAIWFIIEPQQDQWDEAILRKMEVLLRSLHDEGISVTLVIGKTPRWASKAPPNKVAKMYPPSDIAQWRQFVREMAGRFGGELVQAWEIENEVSGKEGFRKHKELYVKMCRAANRIIKSRDPNALILHSSIVPAGEYGQVITYWLRETKNYVDVLNVHKYGSNGEVLENILRFKGFARNAGVSRKPIWLTETNICPNHEPSCQDPSDGGNQLRRRYRMALNNGIDKVFWFPLNSGQWGPGILEMPGQTASGKFEPHQPLYRAYRKMAAGQ